MSAIDEAFGASARARRKALGWVLRDMRDKTGLSLNTCGRIDRGLPATLDSAAAVARALGTTVDTMLAEGAALAEDAYARGKPGSKIPGGPVPE